MLGKFISGILVEVLSDPKIQAYLEKELDKAVEKIKTELLPELIKLLPVFGSSILSAAFDLIPSLENIDVQQAIPEVAKKIIDATPDPDVPILSDIFDLSETIKNVLSSFLLPKDK